MTLTWPTRLLIAGAILATGGYGYWRWDSKRRAIAETEHRRSLARKRKKGEAAKDSADVACLREYMSPGAKLSEQIRASLTYAQAFADPSEVIGLNPRTQTRVYSVASRLANAGETGDMARAVKMILREVMPDCAWDSIALPPEPGSDWEVAYRGVEELLQLAALEMRYEDFHIYKGSGSSVGVRVGLVCPGWNNQAPAPTANLVVGDLIEVLIGAESEDSEPLVTETAFASVTRIEGDTVVAMLVGPNTEIEPGINALPITGSGQHGYRSGKEIQLNRRCVYSVRKGQK
jgi:hypothetical protein